MPSAAPTDVVAALRATYESVTTVSRSLEQRDFLRPTRCSGWAVVDLLFHMLLDAQRALVTFASTVDAEPDVDAVTYWPAFNSEDEGSLRHARFVRISASAYLDPSSW